MLSYFATVPTAATFIYLVSNNPHNNDDDPVSRTMKAVESKGMEVMTRVIVDIESSESAFQLQGILFRLHRWKGSSRTLAGWEASLTPKKFVRL